MTAISCALHGLTLHRPFPWAFTDADKRVENRGWRPPAWIVGRWIALHSGQHFSRGAAEHMRDGLFSVAARSVPMDDAAHPHSVITCLVRVTGSRQRSADPDDPWVMGPFCWQTPDVATLTSPVPCKGAQGLWPVRLPVLEQLVAALPAAVLADRVLNEQIEAQRRWLETT